MFRNFILPFTLFAILWVDAFGQAPDSIKFPVLSFDPFENFQFVSVSKLPKPSNTSGFAFSNYDYLIPFGLSFSANIIRKQNFQMIASSSIKVQFLFRNENSNLLNGIRKTHFNTDFFLRLHNIYEVSPHDKLRLTFFHRSTHLGDDYVILNNLPSTNYWSADEGNYESIQLQYARTDKSTVVYGGVQYIVRGDTPREKIELQQGALISNFIRGNAGSKIFMGYDLRLLENNDYFLDVLGGVGYKTGKRSHFRIEYFYGHIPFSRLERLIDTQWLALGFYINVSPIDL